MRRQTGSTAWLAKLRRWRNSIPECSSSTCSLHSIREALEPALQDARPSLEHHPVEVAAAADLPRVRMDIQRISEVLMHLLENAGKYSAPENPIKVMSEVQGDRLLTSVADRGPGIDSFEQVSDLREILSRAKPALHRSRHGHGPGHRESDCGSTRRQHRRGQPGGKRIGIFVYAADGERIEEVTQSLRMAALQCRGFCRRSAPTTL